MATSGSESITWAQQLHKEQLKLGDFIEKLSTIAKAALSIQVEDLQASQVALQQDVKSLGRNVAATEQRWEQDSYITLKGIAALEQKILRLEEDMIAFKRPGPSTRQLVAHFVETSHTSQLNAEDLANTSNAPSRRMSIQSYLKTSVRRTQDWSAQAQQCSVKHVDSDRTADHFEQPEARQPRTFSHIVHLASASNTPEPLSGTEAAPTPVQALVSSPVALEPQGVLSLEEYLITCEDEISDRLRTYTKLLVDVFAIGPTDKDRARDRSKSYEKRLVKAFVAGMRDEQQRSILACRLDAQAWTWQIALNETDRIAKTRRKRT